jgi:predicted ATP-dependent serine protease
MPLNQKIPSITALKQSAKRLSSVKGISLNQAFDCIANEHGFTHWPLLVKYFNSTQIDTVDSIWQSLLPGEMLLLSAKANVGKMSLALNIVVLALKNIVPVHYISMHLDKASVLSRIHLIGKENNGSDNQNTEILQVEEGAMNSHALLHYIKNCANGSLIVIDYLQVISDVALHGDTHKDLFYAIRQLCHANNLMVLALSQVADEQSVGSLDSLMGGRSIARYFSHVIHLEHSQTENQGGGNRRNCNLLKSTHYKKQTSLLQFNAETYCFL